MNHYMPFDQRQIEGTMITVKFWNQMERDPVIKTITFTTRPVVGELLYLAGHQLGGNYVSTAHDSGCSCQVYIFKVRDVEHHFEQGVQETIMNCWAV